MVYIVAGLMLLIATAVLIYYISRSEQKRLDSIKQTIRDSGKKDLSEILEWYPREMHEEVTRQWDEMQAEGIK